MLSYALAIIVAISSLVLFSTAFLMSHIHRKDDFLWSGIGLFYALVLWYCAKNITGAVLLGQTAATALLVSYCWQTIKLRRAIANPAKAAEINDFSILRNINGLLKSKKPQVRVPKTPVKTPPKSKVTEQEIAIPDATSEENIADTSVSSKESIEPVSQPEVEQPIPNKEANLKAQTPPETQSLKPPTTKPTTATTQSEPIIANQDNQPLNKSANAEPQPENSSAINFDRTKSASEISETPEVPKKVSPINDLETVEVAEVLEAVSEDKTTNRDSDPANIIEVTTTEIKVTQEVKQIEQNQQDDSEFGNG